MVFSQSQKFLIIFLGLAVISGSAVLGYRIWQEYTVSNSQKTEPTITEMVLSESVVMTSKTSIKKLTKSEKEKLQKALKININTASSEELQKIPYIGPKKAEKIIAGRPYRRIEDIIRVHGFGEKTLDKIKDHITAAGTGLDDYRPSAERTKVLKVKKARQTLKININTASSPQLQKLSGIGPKTAAKIIAGRPYKRIGNITNVHGIGEKTFERLKDYITVESPRPEKNKSAGRWITKTKPKKTK